MGVRDIYFLVFYVYSQSSFIAALYNAIYNHVVSRPDVAELTVEDPAEAFEDLRDRNDLRMLLAHTRFMEEGLRNNEVTGSHGGGKVKKVKGRGTVDRVRGKGKLGPPCDKVWAEKWRKELKIAGVRLLKYVSNSNNLMGVFSSDNFNVSSK